MYSTLVVYTNGATRVVSAGDDRGRIRSGDVSMLVHWVIYDYTLLRVSQQACEANCRHAPVSHRQQRRTDDTEDTDGYAPVNNDPRRRWCTVRPRKYRPARSFTVRPR